MIAQITVDGRELKLNRFITELTASIIDAIARSLKFTEGNKIEFRLRSSELTMHVDEQEVSLKLGNASHIISDVLQGLLSNLYGAESPEEVRFVCVRHLD